MDDSSKALSRPRLEELIERSSEVFDLSGQLCEACWDGLRTAAFTRSEPDWDCIAAMYSELRAKVSHLLAEELERAPSEFLPVLHVIRTAHRITQAIDAKIKRRDDYSYYDMLSCCNQFGQINDEGLEAIRNLPEHIQPIDRFAFLDSPNPPSFVESAVPAAPSASSETMPVTTADDKTAENGSDNSTPAVSASPDTIEQREGEGEPDAVGGFFGGRDLANLLGVDPKKSDAFLKRLERVRLRLNDNDWQEVPNRRKNMAKYQYRADSLQVQVLAQGYRS